MSGRYKMEKPAARPPKLCASPSRSWGSRLIQDRVLFLWIGKRPPKRINPVHGSNTHALAALAVGGKLTKRVHGSFECRGAFARLQGASRWAACNRDLTAKLPRWQMTRPNRGKVELRLFPALKGKGVALTLCRVQLEHRSS